MLQVVSGRPVALALWHARNTHIRRSRDEWCRVSSLQRWTHNTLTSAGFLELVHVCSVLSDTYIRIFMHTHTYVIFQLACVVVIIFIKLCQGIKGSVIFFNNKSFK